MYSAGSDQPLKAAAQTEISVVVVLPGELYNRFMNSIPETALPFFQEYDFERLDAERDRDLLIERLLAYGNQDEVRWLLQNYGWAYVRHWLSESGARRLPMRRYRLWCVLFDVTETKRKQIWPY